LFEATKAVVSVNYPDWVPDAMRMHMLEWAQMIERDELEARNALK
jgi:hypothetical protein